MLDATMQLFCTHILQAYFMINVCPVLLPQSVERVMGHLSLDKATLKEKDLNICYDFMNFLE